jgi:predicted protein tyrosine phosphatase
MNQSDMKVFIISKLEFEGVLKTLNPDEVKHIFFISILDPEVKDALHPDSDNYKTFWFYDVEEDIGNFKAVTDEQIQDLYDFITSQEGREMCYVHCSAGISRSGAVGTFINDYFEQDYKKFRKRHSHIHPNGRVLRLLNRKLRESK